MQTQNGQVSTLIINLNIQGGLLGNAGPSPTGAGVHINICCPPAPKTNSSGPVPWTMITPPPAPRRLEMLETSFRGMEAGLGLDSNCFRTGHHDQATVSPTVESEKTNFPVVIPSIQDLEAQIRATDDCFFQKIDITRASLQGLIKGKWLNDEIINGYIALLLHTQTKGRIAAMPTHFYTKFLDLGHDSFSYDNVRWWGQKKAEKEGVPSIFSLEELWIPVHYGENHWVTVIVHLDLHEIQLYDSLSSWPEPKLAQRILQYLSFEANSLGHEFKRSNWKVVYPECPQQTNASDCGLYVCAILYHNCYSKQVPLEVFPSRRILAASLLQRHALDICQGTFDMSKDARKLNMSTSSSTLTEKKSFFGESHEATDKVLVGAPDDPSVQLIDGNPSKDAKVTRKAARRALRTRRKAVSRVVTDLEMPIYEKPANASNSHVKKGNVDNPIERGMPQQFPKEQEGRCHSNEYTPSGCLTGNDLKVLSERIEVDEFSCLLNDASDMSLIDTRGAGSDITMAPLKTDGIDAEEDEMQQDSSDEHEPVHSRYTQSSISSPFGKGWMSIRHEGEQRNYHISPTEKCFPSAKAAKQFIDLVQKSKGNEEKAWVLFKELHGKSAGYASIPPRISALLQASAVNAKDMSPALNDKKEILDYAMKNGWEKIQGRNGFSTKSYYVSPWDKCFKSIPAVKDFLALLEEHESNEELAWKTFRERKGVHWHRYASASIPPRVVKSKKSEVAGTRVWKNSKASRKSQRNHKSLGKPCKDKKNAAPERGDSTSRESCWYSMKIVDHRYVGKEIQYKVRWHGRSKENDTWESEHAIDDTTLIEEYLNAGRRKRRRKK